AGRGSFMHRILRSGSAWLRRALARDAAQPTHRAPDAAGSGQILRRNRSDWLSETERRAGLDFAQRFAQIYAQRFRLLITVLRIFCERAIENGLKTRRRGTRPRLIEWHRILVQHCVPHIDAGLALKRPRAG